VETSRRARTENERCMMDVEESCGVVVCVSEWCMEGSGGSLMGGLK
jgi:hypothetical protein